MKSISGGGGDEATKELLSYSEEARRFEDTARDNVDGVMEILRSDYGNTYFVTGIFTSAIYSDDCIFEDPTISFRGTELYERAQLEITGSLSSKMHPLSCKICTRSWCSHVPSVRKFLGSFLTPLNPERAHMPKNLWERVKLPRNYKKALETIDKHLLCCLSYYNTRSNKD
ncbi:hypothetical protein Bca4012_017963 [Brassica carinata]